jgi:two-component system, NarL family, sensor kinase
MVFNSSKNRLLLLIITCLTFFSSKAQEQSVQIWRDALAGVHHDSISQQIEYCTKLIHYYSEANTDSMLHYRRRLLEKIKQVTTPDKLLKVYAKVIREEMLIGYIDLSKQITTPAIELCKSQRNYEVQSKINYYYGYYYQTYRSNTDSAASYYIKSLRISSKVNDKVMLAHVNSAIGILYLNNAQCDSAARYIQNATRLHQQMKDSFNLMMDLLNTGSVLACQGKKEDAITFYKQTLTLSRKKGNVAVELNAMYNLANVSSLTGKNEEAALQVNELLSRAKELNNKTVILNATTLYASIKLNKKDYKAAILNAKEALKTAKEMASVAFIASCYDIMINASKASGDYETAFQTLTAEKKFNDSLSKIKNTRYLERLKGEYNLDLKNKELNEKTLLLEQKAKDSRSKNSIIALLIALLISFLVFFYLYKGRRKAQQLLQEQALTLVKQQQDFKSFMDGQESERKRIASDLHDGLAQNLVMLGIKVASVKSETEVEKEKKQEVQNEINQLINETRKIAYNMMPDVLIELGLQKALKSLVNRMNQMNTLSFELKYQEPFLPISSSAEIQLYRIVQEALNNVIKHAKASWCEVNICSTNSGIKLIISDNGRGFDRKEQKQEGMGLKSLTSRVNSLGGTYKLVTAPGLGCKIIVDLP